MRIGIDCRLAGIEHAGLGRYIQSLVSQLLTEHQEVEWVLFFSQKKQHQLFAHLGRFEAIYTPVKHYTLREQWQMWHIFKRAQLDLLHVPHFNLPIMYDQPVVITIHDLLWHTQRGARVTTLPSWIYWPKYLAYKLVVRSALTRAKLILVPSNSVKSTLSQLYPDVKTKIQVTYEGASLLPPEPLTFSLPDKYLLYVGSLYPHKNVELILQAMQHISYPLVVVTARSAFTQQFVLLIKKYNLESRVQILHQVSDAQLHTVYQKAFCLVQPSLSEGFGLTGVEALAAGAPLLASDIPVFREIYQEGALYFDPHNPKSLVDLINQLPGQKPNFVTQAKKVAAQYSWKKTAQLTFQAYRQATQMTA
ncbi:MAG TPA: glycosyltransferase family 1 protein [Candidatus Woesebacteria bacterium]|nr:glycosyltransferase family 1 protein [Candidatus Woesebacteria bacterium]